MFYCYNISRDLTYTRSSTICICTLKHCIYLLSFVCLLLNDTNLATNLGRTWYYWWFNIWKINTCPIKKVFSDGWSIRFGNITYTYILKLDRSTWCSITCPWIERFQTRLFEIYVFRLPINFRFGINIQWHFLKESNCVETTQWRSPEIIVIVLAIEHTLCVFPLQCIPQGWHYYC